MKIFSAAQIREWDTYTITHEPISAIDLMERAATACFTWLSTNLSNAGSYTIFCGTGNNGGDGLAIARLLMLAGNKVMICILNSDKQSEDFKVNLDSITSLKADLHFINGSELPDFLPGSVLIDALFGTGLTRPLQGAAADLVVKINFRSNIVVSIDMPSGMFADAASGGNPIIEANHTLSFQLYKLAFLLAENQQYTGQVHLLDIGLHNQFYDLTHTLFNTTDNKAIGSIYKPRNQFLHKYNFGHALLYTGSKNMMGAAVLCAKACLRSGAGLVTVFTEEGTQPVIQTALPEAISSTDYDFKRLSQKKSAIGIGPGLALTSANKELLWSVITNDECPLVIDASALQLLAADVSVLKLRTVQPAILTPHTGEFEKLFGKTNNDFELLKKAMQQSTELGCYIVLKGHYTLVACPNGTAFFNTTGNAGMATAGSGDVLTGIITGLCAQGYAQKEACLLGVYLHGLSGDTAAEKNSQEALIAGDIIESLGAAFLKIQRESAM